MLRDSADRARVVTMKGDEVIDDATIVITNDRITAIGPSGRVTIPAGAKTFDVRGKTIIPGFIDLHAHFPTDDDENLAIRKWAFHANLAYGVTISREANGPITLYGNTELIEAGELLGPRIFIAGPAIHTTRGSRLKNLEEARVVVQHRKALGAVVVKEYTVRPRRERQWVKRAADEAGLNVMVHGHQPPIDLVLRHHSH